MLSLPKGEHGGFWRESKLDWEEARRHNEARPEVQVECREVQLECPEVQVERPEVQVKSREAEARRRKDCLGVDEEQCNVLGEGGQQPHYWLLRETCDANILVNYI